MYVWLFLSFVRSFAGCDCLERFILSDGSCSTSSYLCFLMALSIGSVSAFDGCFVRVFRLVCFCVFACSLVENSLFLCAFAFRVKLFCFLSSRDCAYHVCSYFGCLGLLKTCFVSTVCFCVCGLV